MATGGRCSGMMPAKLLLSALCCVGSSYLTAEAFIPSRSAVRVVVTSTSSHQSQSWHRHKHPNPNSTKEGKCDNNGNLHLFPIDFNYSQPSINNESDQALALWVFAFASSHIGMSATRTTIISSLGKAANTFNLVGNEEWTLPNYWPGDNTGGNRILPDNLTAGRQIYRALYTAVSFATLGCAFGAYLHSSSISMSDDIDIINASDSSFAYNACLFSAALSLGASLASLFNASPLGLMPSFEGTSSDEADAVADNSIAGIRRDDTLKFTTRGLTRITRHPLILPVVPWGFATAYLAGGRPCDYIIFGGLSIYAMAGCFAQDLRVIREEGSVGTVFQTESREKREEGDEEERTQLRLFFGETSFIPFKAVIDGRQSLNDVAREFPWVQLLVGSISGVFIEEKVLQLLGDLSTS